MERVRGWRGLALALCLGVALTGCGGGSGKDKKAAAKATPTTFSGDADKACRLATKSDVEAAIGSTVNPGLGSNGTVCRYELASSAAQFVSIESNESPQSSQIYDLLLSGASGAENLTGVGDRAFVAGTRAVVLRGPKLTTITVGTGQPQAAVTAALKKLAQAVGLHS